MVEIITIDELLRNREKIEFLTDLIGKNYSTIAYGGDIGVFDELSEICLIEIRTESAISKFSINSRDYEVDTFGKRTITEFINYLSESNIAFRIKDDGIYVGNISIKDTRFVITISNRIDFYFEFLDSEKAFQLIKIGVREIFVPKVAKNSINQPAS